MGETSWHDQFANQEPSLRGSCRILDDRDGAARVWEGIAGFQPILELLHLEPEESTEPEGKMKMAIRASNALVRYLPETLGRKQQRLFFAEVESCFNIDRPCIVLDCSKVRQMDRSAIHVLLCCLEEAMKRNGDVKLAAIPVESRALLEATGVDRLFEVFDTSAEALTSFGQLNVGADLNLNMPGSSHLGSENAA